MTTTMSVDEAQAKLAEVIARLAPGEEVVITQNQQPVARIIGQRQPSPPRPGPGLCQGMLTIVADDEEHLKDFEEYMP